MNIVLGKRIDRHLGGFLTRLLVPFAGGRRGRDAATREEAPRTVVLVKLWGLGNIVLLAPWVSALRERFPGTRIVFLSFSTNREALLRMANVDEVLALDLRSWARFAISLVRAVIRLRRLSADRLVDFEQFCYLSSVIAFVSGARSTVGFATEGSLRGRLYDEPVPYREDGHMVEIFGRLLRWAGLSRRPGRLVRIRHTEREGRRSFALVPSRSGRPVVGLHPGSGDNFPGRRWSEDRFAALADELVRRFDAVIYFTGSRDEEDLVERIRFRMRHPSFNLAGQTSLGVLAALLHRSALYVSNDTGPLHVAAAMGTPIAALYGPNTPVLYGPYTERALVFYRNLPCSPCISNLNLKESSCRHAECVLSIRPEEVIHGIETHGFLGRREPARSTDSEVVEC